MSKCLEQLARKYYGTKFVKIVSTDCIAKYPDSLLPTLIVYRNGKPEKNINGMGSFGGKRISPESECEQKRARSAARQTAWLLRSPEICIA